MSSVPEGSDLERALAHTRYHHFPGGRKKIRALLGQLRALDAGTPSVLDVGCGNGQLAFPLAAVGCEVLGVDVDRASIRACRDANRFPGARFRHTGGDLSEVEERFDLVVCSEVLEHLGDPGALVSAMREKLAPDGRLFITVPNGYGPREVGGRLESFLRELPGVGGAVERVRGLLESGTMVSEEEKHEMHTSNPHQVHVQRFTPTGLRSRLRARGLEVVDWENSFLILSVFWCRRGESPVERADEWLAERLPPAAASGWYVTCRRAEGAGP